MEQEQPSSSVPAKECPVDDEASQSDHSEASWVDDSDTIENACMLFPVFCTADMPAKILDSLITSTRDSFPPSCGSALCILTSPSPDEHTHGTRVPTHDISAPFQGKSITELASLFLNNFAPRESWSERAFAVLDAQSARDGSSILLVTIEDDDEAGPVRVLYYRCEFGCSIDQLIVYDEGLLGMENDARDLLGTDKVFTVERFTGMITGTWKGTGAEGNRMGRSYMGPEGTGRVKGL